MGNWALGKPQLTFFTQGATWFTTVPKLSCEAAQNRFLRFKGLGFFKKCKNLKIDRGLYFLTIDITHESWPPSLNGWAIPLNRKKLYFQRGKNESFSVLTGRMEKARSDFFTLPTLRHWRNFKRIKTTKRSFILCQFFSSQWRNRSYQWRQ